jgi:predicted NAD/FAD-dependent oxidoreductase
VWSHGFGDHDGHARYRATAGMNSLAKDLAQGVDVRCSTMAFAVRPAETGDDWHVVIDDATVHTADAVIITSPLPQSFALLADSGIELDETLMRTDYDRTIAVLATLDRPSAVDEPGGVQRPTPEVAFVADNAAKGVSATPAITLHAAADWSEQHWDDDIEELRRSLVDLAAPWIGEAQIGEVQVKKWRFATPRSIWPDPCWVAPGGRIVLAGDAFDGPRVEAAHNSGLAAAHALTG